MTSNKNSITTVQCGGISCKSDICLYDDRPYSNYVYLLSLYGAPQSTKGIFSLLAAGQALEAEDVFLERPPEPIRMRGTKISYAKYHALVWSDKIGKDIIVWTSEKERLDQLHGSLSQRRVPLNRTKLPEIENLLVQNKYLLPLAGWGGIGGYITNFNDDDICDLILSSIYKDRQVSTGNAA